MIINKKICPAGLGNNPNCQMASIGWITIHNTGNFAATATAKAHADYLYGGSAKDKISWHYTCDSDSVWQSFEDRSYCWHTGTSQGNGASIGIEICLNSRDGFKQACRNAAELTAGLLKAYSLPLSRVVQHNYWSGKDCPQLLRNGSWGVTWKEFLSLVEGFLSGTEMLYRVQIGAFYKKENAEAVLAQAKKTGFSDAFIKAEEVAPSKGEQK